MADNVRASIGTQDGPTFATDDDGTAHWPYTKIAFGGDNTQTKVSTTDPLPVKAGANDGVDIGDVDVTSIVPGVGATNLGKAEDAVHASGDVGVVALAVRRDTAAVGSGADGDYSTINVDASGRVHTAVGGDALTALQLIDDAVFADDAAFTAGTSKANAVAGLAVACSADPDAADAADAAVPILTRHRQQWVVGGHPNMKSATYLWTAATTDDNVMPAISAGTKYAITRITITLDEAATVGVACRLGFGTANVPALPAANGDAVDDILFYHPGMVPGSVHTVGDGAGILGVGGDGAELRITSEATTGGTGVVTVSYFTLPS